ncbi:MAG: NAD(P)/FAD-dependent oxidoreductase, partial [Clostridia bacterium]|nr:NAD(P)/FAD-dependent oxidoreductase [Clostridia bacterium]
GVPAEELDDDLQSKKCENLYLAGEVVDVDGDCGGYNLHWAFASGMHVAKSIAESYK